MAKESIEWRYDELIKQVRSLQQQVEQLREKLSRVEAQRDILDEKLRCLERMIVTSHDQN